MSKYDRTNFMTQEYLLDNKRGYDLTSNKVNNYKFTRPKIRYTVSEQDICRPDLIAIKGYETIEAQGWWWIVMWYNEIYDVFNDLQVGDVLYLPNRLDIEDFVAQNS